MTPLYCPFCIFGLYLRCSNQYTNLHVQVDDQGYLQLVDFGFAKRLPSDPGSDGRLFTVCGTPGRKEEVVGYGHLCDLIYLTVTGKIPPYQ